MLQIKKTLDQSYLVNRRTTNPIPTQPKIPAASSASQPYQFNEHQHPETNPHSTNPQSPKTRTQK